MDPKEMAQDLARLIPALTPERGWTEQERTEFAEELERVFSTPPTEEDLAKADVLLAEMAEVAAKRKHTPGVSRVIFRSRKGGGGND